MRKNCLRFARSALGLALLGTASIVCAQEQPPPAQEPAGQESTSQLETMPDTASAHPNNSSDVELTRRIRKELVGDKSLSVYGQNITIVSQDGNVLLRGPVNSEAEKQEIERVVARFTGQGNIRNELQVNR